MPTRMSVLFDFTTDPADRTTASAHSGGWSEGLWYTSSSGPSSQLRQLIFTYRAILSSQEVSIVGYRLEQFTIAGNKLLPGGTSSAKVLFPGLGVPMDAPQIGLQLGGVGVGGVNTNRIVLRGLPDNVVMFGEYQPVPSYKGAVTTWANYVIQSGAGFIGRDKTQPSARVNNIAAGVVTLAANVGGVQGVDYLRFNRVYNAQGLPVKGSYLITNIAGNVYTLQGLNQTLILPSGSARLDRIAFFAYESIKPGRLVSKKVGRPFEQYRGRRSKSRV
jgi:hypothetical protein